MLAAVEGYRQACARTKSRYAERKIVVSCRVASAGQKADLESQKKAVEQFRSAAGKPVALWLSNLGSGLNCRRKNLALLMETIERSAVSKIVIAHRHGWCTAGRNGLKSPARIMAPP